MADYSGPLLKPGSSGSGVAELQTGLQSLGYNIGSSGVDSIFGPSTASALKQFQADKGLTVDGIYGQQSYSALMGGSPTSATTTVSAPSATPSFYIDPNNISGGSLMQSAVKMFNDQAAQQAYTVNPYSADPNIKYMTQEEAMTKAAALLNPQYAVSAQNLAEQQQNNQVKRGIFFSPLATNLEAKAQAQLEGSKNIALAQYISELLANDQSRVDTLKQNDFGNWLSKEGLNLEAYSQNQDRTQGLLAALQNLQQAQQQAEEAAADRAAQLAAARASASRSSSSGTSPTGGVAATDPNSDGGTAITEAEIKKYQVAYGTDYNTAKAMLSVLKNSPSQSSAYSELKAGTSEGIISAEQQKLINRAIGDEWWRWSVTNPNTGTSGGGSTYDNRAVAQQAADWLAKYK